MHGNRQSCKNYCKMGYEHSKKWNSRVLGVQRKKGLQGASTYKGLMEVVGCLLGFLGPVEWRHEATPSRWNGLGRPTQWN